MGSVAPVNVKPAQKKGAWTGRFTSACSKVSFAMKASCTSRTCRVPRQVREGRMEPMHEGDRQRVDGRPQ